ncbi:aspartate aminotransferase family protein [Jiangella anatolica]|uniref:Aspartate aminotransferase family protein n=1 Tax=Jiangella anatolica TaxID=2670374 RepID=A0A2W2C3Z6_9ACTN|nr:aspartate aminotransferase family protein [Jiangella anatolica]PZF86678.1 aspartate aminotransferase family protein [Jiangella anatolica]
MEWSQSAQMYERAKLSLPGGVSSGLRAAMRPHPLFFERGAGSRLWDVDGREYVDYVLGWGPLILGNSHPALVDAVTRQLAAGQSSGAGHSREFELAERVCAAIPGMDKVLWSNTGSEAAQIALRLVRAATGRVRFIKFHGHYHGWSDAMLLGYRPAADGSLDGLTSRGQHPRAPADAVMLPWNDLPAVAAALSGPDHDIAAIFTEPALCNSGVLPPAPGFLAGLRELCDAHGVVLVFDEVITGFRIAYGGGTERYGVSPDLAVLAKAIAGGLPLSAVAGRAAVMDLATQGVVHAGTYNGGPLALAAADATLTELARPGVYEAFEERAGQLTQGMRKALADHGVTGAVHHVGPVVQCTPGVPAGDSFATFMSADWDWYGALTVELLRRGIYVLPGGRWYLSTVHDEADVNRTVAAFGAAVAATVDTTGRPR